MQGVRDGPVGSEGNVTVKEYLPKDNDQITFPERPFDMGQKLEHKCNVKSVATKFCQTEIHMVELEEAMHAFNMLKALQQRDNDGDSVEHEGHEVVESPLKDVVDIYIDVGRYQHERSSNLKEDVIEKRDCFLVEKGESSQDNDSLSGYNSSTFSGLVECEDTVDKYAVISEDEDAFDKLSPGKPKELIDHGNIAGITDGVKEPTGRSVRDSDTEYPASEEKFTKRRRLFTRTDSVSTDESNTSDEMGDILIEDVPKKPEPSPRSEHSAADSELSDASISAKRGRRIGISAEPVRLPTWTELRESIKLNQQIFLEEEVTNCRFVRTPRNSLDESNNSNLKLDINFNRSNDKEAIESLRTADGANLADISIESCYESGKDHTDKSK